jgi:hypothetical protein
MMRKKPVMTSERMEGLQLPLNALAVWAIALGLIGYVFGMAFGVLGLAVGAAIGLYAAFGRSRVAVALRWPAVAIGYGVTLIAGSK